MAVKIKLKRMGKIHAPYYRIVVSDARTKRDGRAIEEIGKYHPKSEPSFIEVSSERAQYWLSVGAQPTGPVRRLLEITGDWQKFRGEPGAEGTLRVAAPKAGKGERFAEAVGQTKTAEAAPKGRARKPDTEAKADARPDKTEAAARRKPRTARPDAPGKAGRAVGRAADKPAEAEATGASVPGVGTPEAGTGGAGTGEAGRAETSGAEATGTPEAGTGGAETPGAGTPEVEASAPEAESAEAQAAAPEAEAGAGTAEPESGG